MAAASASSDEKQIKKYLIFSKVLEDYRRHM